MFWLRQCRRVWHLFYIECVDLRSPFPVCVSQAKNKFIMLKVLKELSVKGGSAKLMDDTPTTKSLRSNKSLSTQVSESENPHMSRCVYILVARRHAYR